MIKRTQSSFNLVICFLYKATVFCHMYMSCIATGKLHRQYHQVPSVNKYSISFFDVVDTIHLRIVCSKSNKKKVNKKKKLLIILSISERCCFFLNFCYGCKMVIWLLTGDHIVYVKFCTESSRSGLKYCTILVYREWKGQKGSWTLLLTSLQKLLSQILNRLLISLVSLQMKIFTDEASDFDYPME